MAKPRGVQRLGLPRLTKVVDRLTFIAQRYFPESGTFEVVQRVPLVQRRQPQCSRVGSSDAGLKMYRFAQGKVCERGQHPSIIWT